MAFDFVIIGGGSVGGKVVWRPGRYRRRARSWRASARARADADCLCKLAARSL